MQLIDGAEAIAGDLPQAATRRVSVPLGAGESLGSGVQRLSALRSVREAVEVAIAAVTVPDARIPDARGDATLSETNLSDTNLVVTIGGDCGVELAPISAAVERVRESGGRLAVVWLDAHADLHAPDPEEPGAFSGMVLRTLLGEGSELLVPEPGQTLDGACLVLAGVRSFDDDEEAVIASRSIASIGVEALGDPSALVAAVLATGATEVYLHVDLDVLDPAEVAGLSFPEPFGISVATLVENIRAVRRQVPVAGAGITQFAPSSPDAAADDLSALLRIISALTRAL